MSDEISFGRWLQRRRKALDLTQKALAQHVGCAPETLRKIEADARRPSRQVAERLADALELPAAERTTFVRAARAELSVDRLAPPTQRVAQVAFVPPAALPAGTVTFLFTDLEGSTRLWDQYPEAMRAALTRHDEILRKAVEAHGGVVFKTVGDGVCAVFASARDSLAAGLAAQHALQREGWGATGPLRVRMALHTGAADVRDGDYFGPPLNRVNRLMAAGHGGQILLSLATQELVRDDLPPEVELHDLGTHRLKDLTRPEHIFQIITPAMTAEFPPLNTLTARPNNLPVQPTPLVGRAADVVQLCTLLRRPDARLVTLIGPGGIGKTRLALQVAAELLDEFDHGVYFVNLAPVSNAELVVSVIAQTLGLKEVGRQALIVSLNRYLREKHLLLVLDNFEQVLDAAARVTDLLAACPHLNVLVTSRTPLHVSGEHEFTVVPLTVPDPNRLPPLDRLSQYEAVRLFVERAQATKADFAITDENALAVITICVRLDGLPLAIELAAARVKLFPAKALLARLHNRLQILTHGLRDLPTRQQTLRNTIDWSYELLTNAEKRLFERLGVFVGGWTLEAMEAVCDPDGALGGLDAMVSLLDQSLLRQVDGPDSEPRLTMLETMREYALERLDDRGGMNLIRRQHASYYLALAEAAESRLTSADQGTWLDRLEAEHDNLRTALAWSLGTQESGEIGLRLGAALWRFWETRGYLNEGRVWLANSLSRPGLTGPTAAHAKVLIGAGHLARSQGDLTTADRLFEASLEVSKAINDQLGIASALYGLGMVAGFRGDYARAAALSADSLMVFRKLGDKQWVIRLLNSQAGQALFQGDYTQAAACFTESLALCQELGDLWLAASALNGLGEVARGQEDDGRAVEHYQEGLMLYREVKDKRGMAITLHNLGQVARRQGHHERAAALFAESLVLLHQLGHKLGDAWALAGLGGLAGARGQPERAARLLGAVDGLLHAINEVLDPTDQIVYQRDLVAVRACLDHATFAAVWAEGQAMTLEQAIAYALSEGVQISD